MERSKKFADTIPAGDIDHSIQAGLLDATSEALSQGRKETHLLMEQLHIYTQVHFMSEQLLMRLNSDPGYRQHLKQHEDLLQELSGIRALVEKGALEKASQQLLVHGEKMLEHIRAWDGGLQSDSSEKSS